MTQFTIFYTSPLIIDARGIENHIIEVEASDVRVAATWLLQWAFENMLPPSPATLIVPSDLLAGKSEQEQRDWWWGQVIAMCEAGSMEFVSIEDMTND